MTATLSINTKLKQDIPVSAGGSDFSLEVITEKLFQIFDEELNAENSIFISVDRNAIAKMAMFISGHIDRSVAIGIAGETASGKSTVAWDIISSIEKFSKEFSLDNVINRINTDDYYYDRSDMVRAAGSFANFAKKYDLDVPNAIELELMKEHILKLVNGKSVMLPKYDMSGTAIRYDDYTLANPSKIIISEGLFTLTEKVCDAFDFKIYVDVSKEIQAQRFFVRAKERSLGASAKNILDNASQKAQIYIRPCKETSDIILSGEADRKRYMNFLSKFLNLIEEVHYEKVCI